MNFFFLHKLFFPRSFSFLAHTHTTQVSERLCAWEGERARDKRVKENGVWEKRNEEIYSHRKYKFPHTHTHVHKRRKKNPLNRKLCMETEFTKSKRVCVRSYRFLTQVDKRSYSWFWEDWHIARLLTHLAHLHTANRQYDAEHKRESTYVGKGQAKMIWKIKNRKSQAVHW